MHVAITRACPSRHDRHRSAPEPVHRRTDHRTTGGSWPTESPVRPHVASTRRAGTAPHERERPPAARSDRVMAAAGAGARRSRPRVGRRRASTTGGRRRRAQGSAIRGVSQVGDTGRVTAGRQRGARPGAGRDRSQPRVGVGVRRCCAASGKAPARANRPTSCSTTRRWLAIADALPATARRSRRGQGRRAGQARAVRRCSACSSGVGHLTDETGVNTAEFAHNRCRSMCTVRHVFGVNSTTELRPTWRGWLHAWAFSLAHPGRRVADPGGEWPGGPRHGVRVRGDVAAAVRHVGRLPPARPLASGATDHAAPRPFDDLPADRRHVRPDLPCRSPAAWGIPMLAVVGVCAVVGVVLKLTSFRRQVGRIRVCTR